MIDTCVMLVCIFSNLQQLHNVMVVIIDQVSEHVLFIATAVVPGI